MAKIKLDRKWRLLKENTIQAAVANFKAKQYTDDYYTGAFEALDHLLTQMDEMENIKEWEAILHDLNKHN